MVKVKIFENRNRIFMHIILRNSMKERKEKKKKKTCVALPKQLEDESAPVPYVDSLPGHGRHVVCPI